TGDRDRPPPNGEAWPASPIPWSMTRQATTQEHHHSVRRLSALQSPSLLENRCRPSPCARAFPGSEYYGGSALSRTDRWSVHPAPPRREFPALNIRAGARRPQPISTRFELVPHQGGVTRRFLAYSSPSRSPNPNHLAVLARLGFVRAAPALPGTTPIRLPSAPPSCCDRISDVGLSPPFESLRFTAHPRSAPRLHRRHTVGPLPRRR